MESYDNAEALAAQFQDRLNAMSAPRSSRHDAGGGGGGKRRGHGGRAGGGGGGGGGGRGGQDGGRAVDVSRALSKLLRHQAGSAGIPLDPEGYAPLDRVLAWGPLRSMRVTLAEVQDVVATNEKQRFALRQERDDSDAAAWSIRANQGHSIPLASDGLLQPIRDAATAPAVVCHGTFVAAWPAILASGGLQPMGRNHVHCGSLDTAVDVNVDVDVDGGDNRGAVFLAQLSRTVPGLRKNATLLIFLDVRRALREDPSLRWWRSANGVVLSEGNADGVVPTRFFQRVVVTSSDQPPLTLWRDGEKVADLPADQLARARMPPNLRAAAGRAAAKPKAKTAVQPSTEAAKEDA